MIRPALPADLDAIAALVPALVAALHASGNDQWHADYPQRRHFEADLAAGALFVDAEANLVRGFVALDGHEPGGYETQPWTNPGPALVVHRLGVNPACQKQGVAKGLLAFAEAEARRRALPNLRSDTSALNPAMAALFAGSGWNRIGTLKFDDATCDFHAWEKTLTKVYAFTDRIAGGDGDGSGGFVRFPWNGKDDSPRTVEVPADLAAGLAADPKARAFFEGLSPSHKKAYVQWITEAKKPETRQRRCEEAVTMLREGKKRQ